MDVLNVTDVCKLFRLRSENSLAHPNSGEQRSSGRWKNSGTPCPGCSQATTGATSLSEPTSTQPEEHRSPKEGGNCVLSRLFPGLSQGTHTHHGPGVILIQASQREQLSASFGLRQLWPGDVRHFAGSRGRAFWNCRTLITGRQDPKVSKAGSQMDQGDPSAQGSTGDRKAQ